MIAIIYAHPYAAHSRANQALLKGISGLPEIELVDLYDQYPNFYIDVQAEQQRLLKADTIVWQHPMQWYHTPALMSLWFEKVLAYGWAYGEHGHALRGKRVLWVCTTGAEQSAYQEKGYNHFPIEQFATPLQQTALFCEMQWLTPLTVFGAGKMSDEQLMEQAERYRDRLVEELRHAR